MISIQTARLEKAWIAELHARGHNRASLARAMKTAYKEQLIKAALVIIVSFTFSFLGSVSIRGLVVHDSDLVVNICGRMRKLEQCVIGYILFLPVVPKLFICRVVSPCNFGDLVCSGGQRGGQRDDGPGH